MAHLVLSRFRSHSLSRPGCLLCAYAHCVLGLVTVWPVKKKKCILIHLEFCFASPYQAMMNNGRAMWPWNFYHFNHYFSSILFNSVGAATTTTVAAATAAASAKSLTRTHTYINTQRIPSRTRWENTLWAYECPETSLCLWMQMKAKSNHSKFLEIDLKVWRT